MKAKVRKAGLNFILHRFSIFLYFHLKAHAVERPVSFQKITNEVPKLPQHSQTALPLWVIIGPLLHLSLRDVPARHGHSSCTSRTMPESVLHRSSNSRLLRPNGRDNYHYQARLAGHSDVVQIPPTSRHPRQRNEERSMEDPWQVEWGVAASHLQARTIHV